MTRNKSPAPAGPAKQDEHGATFRDLFSYLITTYRADLGLTGRGRAWEQINAIVNADKPIIDWRSIREQLDPGRAARNPSTRTRATLTDFIVERLPLPGCEATWLDMPSVAALQARIKEAADHAARERVANSARQTTIEFAIPTRRDLAQELTELFGHYVSYRFAFESGSEDMIAREVVTFSPDENKIAFRMSFVFEEKDTGGGEQAFTGHVLPLGQSLMCIGVHGDASNPDRNRDRDRGRCMFLHRSEFDAARGVRFGMLSTTRAKSPFEPCTACILMFRVDASIPESELMEFRRRVTIIRPLNNIIGSDFSKLTPAARDLLEKFLDNRPRGIAPGTEGEGRDRVLRLLYGRFGDNVVPILRQTYDDDEVKAPFKANWRKAYLG